MSSKVQLSLGFEGPFAQIDANTAVSCLFHFLALTQKVAEDVRVSLDIRIKETKSGSFFIELIVQAKGWWGHLSSLFTDENLQRALWVVQIITDLFIIKSFLKGQKAQREERKGDKVLLTNQDGESLKVPVKSFDIFKTDEIADRALKSLFERLEEDPSVHQFGFTSFKDHQVFTSVAVSREAFAYFIEDNPYFEEEAKREIEKRTLLTVVKVVFAPRRKWEFIWQGTRISAYVKDEEFYKKLDEGESFSKGDVLIADLEVIKIFDRTLNTFVNKDFNVLKVYEHRKFVQPSLFSS